MFFQELFNLSESLEVSMSIKRKNDQLTISFLPAGTPGISPVIITGSPAKLDEGFIQAVASPVEAAAGLQVATKDFNDSVSTAKPTAREKKAEKVNKPKPVPAAPENKPEEDSAKSPEPTLFDEP